jgi:hypothetical protein
MFNIIQFTEKQLNAIGLLDISSNTLGHQKQYAQDDQV